MQYGNYCVLTDESTGKPMDLFDMDLMRDAVTLCHKDMMQYAQQIMEEKPGSRFLSGQIIIKAILDDFPETIAWKMTMLEPGEELPYDPLKPRMKFNDARRDNA